MSTVPTPSQERSYPIPAPASDRRFTFGLTIDVARVLADHGYPPITVGGDLVALQQALFGFLYQSTPTDPGARSDDGYAEGYADGWYRRPDSEPETRHAAAEFADQIGAVLDGTGPIPAGVDPEIGAAVRRIAQHFRDHGCLSWTPAPAGVRSS